MTTSDPPFEPSAEVSQAAGMVSVQADCLIEEALRMMRDRAAVAHATLEEIAAAVMDGSIRFGE
jgi:AmiR/NasT family two-component response regulator